jgi:hypothetical protein
MKQFIHAAILPHCKRKVELKDTVIANLCMTYQDLNFLAPLKKDGEPLTTLSFHLVLGFGFHPLCS